MKIAHRLLFVMGLVSALVLRSKALLSVRTGTSLYVTPEILSISTNKTAPNVLLVFAMA